MNKQEIKKVCCRFFTHLCPVKVHLINGEITKIERDSLSVCGQYFFCERCSLGALDFHNHPHRLNYPMKIVGTKGEGKWTQIKWERALGEIAEKVDYIKARYGPKAVTMMVGYGADPFIWPPFRFY